MSWMHDFVARLVIWFNIVLLIYKGFDLYKFWSVPLSLWFVENSFLIFILSFVVILFTYKGGGLLNLFRGVLRK